MNAKDLHSKIWMEKAGELCEKLGLTGKSAQEIEIWWSNKKNEMLFYEEVKKYYKIVAQEMNLDFRFIKYFASCVLSHHKGDIHKHSRPVKLRLDILYNDLEDFLLSKDSFYKVFFKPHIPVPSKEDFWQLCTPPRDFYVAWPNHFIAEHLNFNPIRKKVKNKVVGMSVSFQCFVNYSAYYNGRWWDGRYLVGPGLAGRPIKEVLGLPKDARVYPKIIPIPCPAFGDDFEIHLTGGKPIEPYSPDKQQHVVRSMHLSGKKEKEYADKSEKVINIVAGKETNRGSKKKYSKYTNGSFKSFIQKVYRELLKKKKDTHLPDVIEEVRDRVRTIRSNYVNEYGYYQDINDTSIPNKWFEEIEEELRT